jgi:lipopolysaccharide cholinephosphotransferase
MGGTKKLTGKYLTLAEKMLRDVTDVLDSQKIPYVLEGGTLLGIVRENRLLPWDNDLDITITRQHTEALIAARWRFWLKGYRTRIHPHLEDTEHFKKGSPRILVIQIPKFLVVKDFSLMDIFIKDTFDEKTFWSVGRKTKVLKSTLKKYYENTTKIEFQGKMYTIPAEYDAYLTSRYGDWRKPQEVYDYKKDDLSIQNQN